MAQVKGTLWFGTDITDDALRKAQQLRQQIEQQFAKDVNVKLNIQGLDNIGQQSKQTHSQLSAMANALSSQNVKLTGIEAIKDRLFDVQRWLKDAQKDLAFWKKEINSAGRKGDIKGVEEMQAYFRGTQNTVAQLTKEYNTLTRQLQTAKLQESEMRKQSQLTARAQREATEELRNRTKVYAQLNSDMKASIGITGQLTDGMAGMYSVYKAKEFLENVIAIGGQLEQQRVSIGAILHDTAHADDLFGRIKNLALQSPFGVLDLDKYTKQLSAYGFRYNELFDMTKRLADISAGAGTDISRLALALGHVKSATYLTGITLRQFSMNNIPMLEMLSKYYSELENRIVTTAEVQKRISARDVGYEEVIEVIKRMTDEGGQFYNMQAVMADTLAGKWKNLRDAVQLMYGSIADTWVGDSLKGLATILTNATTHWREFGAAMGAAALVFGTYRASAMFMNSALGQENAAIMRNAMAWKQAEAQKLQTASLYRVLSVDEKRLIASTNSLTSAELRNMLAAGTLNKEYVLRNIALGKIKAGQAGHLAGIAGITKAEIKAALAMSNTNKVILRTRLALSELGRSLKALVWNPAMGWFAALTAAFEIYNHYAQQAEKSSERVKHALDTATEGYKNLSEAASQFKPGMGQNMSNDALRQAVDSMIGTLKDYSSQAQNIIRNALYVDPNEKDNEKLQIRSLADQYNILAQSLQYVKDAYELMKDASNVFENANKETGGTWFWNDSFAKNAKDYMDELNNVKEAELRFMRDRGALNKALVLTGVFTDAPNASYEEIKNYIHGLSLVSDEYKKIQSFADEWKGGIGFSKSFNIFNKAKEDFDASEAILRKEIEDFATKSLKDLEISFGKAVDKWGQSERLAAQQSLYIFLSQIEGATDEGIRAVEGKVYDYWNRNNDYLQSNPLTIDADTDRAMKQLTEFQQYLENLVGKDWVVKLHLQKVGTFEELYDQLDDNVKKAKETMRKVGSGLTDAEKEQATSFAASLESLSNKQLEYREAYELYQESVKAANKEGFKLTSLEDKEGRSGGGKKTDEFAKQMSERVQLLKKAQQEYKKWLNLESKADAFNRISKNGAFASLFRDRKITQLDDIRDALREYQSQLNPRKSEQQKVIATIDELLLGMDNDEAKERADETIALLQSAMDKVVAQWDVYKSLLEKTGDEKYAELAFSKGILWDDKTRAMADELSSRAGLGTISYDMSEDKAKEFFNYNTEKGKALYEQWKRIVDLIGKNYNDALQTGADAIQKTMSIQQKISDAESKRDNELNTARGAMLTEEAQLAIVSKWDEEIAKLKGELFELSPEFKELLVDTTSMSVRQLTELYNKARALKSMIDQTRKRTDYDVNGQVRGYYYGDNQYISKDAYDRIDKTIDKTRKKASQIQIAFKELWGWVSGEDADNNGKADRGFKDIADDLAEVAQEAAATANALGSMFEALGEEGIADGLSFAGDMLNSVQQISAGIASGNPLAVIQGIASGISSIAAHHDKKLDKAIQKSARRVKELQYAYNNLESEMNRVLGGIYTAGNYDEMFKNYQAQLAELEKQRKAENDKKKKDKDKLLDYDQQIKETEEAIRGFAEDMAKALYEIDVKSWAQELTDAVVDAWVKGEDAAQAWHDKVRDLVQDVTKNVLAQKVVEKTLEPVLDYVTKQMTAKSGKLDESDVVQMAKLLDAAGESSVNTITSLLDAMKRAGYDMTDAESAKSGNLSSSIQSITEEAGDLLLSHVNAIRADVSITRFDMDRVVSQIEMQLPIFGQSIAEQTAVLRSIESNTGRNADSAEAIETFCRGLRDGTYSIKVK